MNFDQLFISTLKVYVKTFALDPYQIDFRMIKHNIVNNTLSFGKYHEVRSLFLQYARPSESV